MNLRGGRASDVADRLLERIVDGRHVPGSRLPTEPELCAEMGVSRVTLREAVKSLQQRGVVSVEQGRGTFVNPEASWSPFDPVLLAARTGGPDGPDPAWAQKLLEVRRMVEVAVSALAAQRRTDEDLAMMRSRLDAMRAAHGAGDVAAFAEADLAFHNAILAAADNELVAALFDPISRLVHDNRLATSRPAERQAHALRAHLVIYGAIVDGDPVAASQAMQRHIDDTIGYVASTAGKVELDPAVEAAGA